MRESIFKKAHLAEERIASMGREATRFKQFASDTVADTMDEARRAAKRGYRTAQDLFDTAEHRIKRHPWQCIAIALGIGAVLGLLIPRSRRSS
jgi:ElaB/YqjD/DUF883 family membrane-anchored ribosome-binding protein